ncbi:MAG: B12-binding radical protein [Deltaproteobacteria bacterium]|nr:B12-binding radical protein [Deltaproteobacteria bacterium]
MKKVVILGSVEGLNPVSTPPGWLNKVAPPLSIVAVGSYLQAHGVPVELIDIEVDFGLGLTRSARQAVGRRVADYLAAQAEDIAWVGISLHTNVSLGMSEDTSPIEPIHAALPQMPLILGGYLASIDYHVLLQKYPFVTAVVRGDGEAPALAISRRLAQGQSVPAAEIPNLAWTDRGTIHTTPIQSLPPAELPIFDFTLLRHHRCYEKVDLMMSRGCPFTCDYCLENLMRPFGAYPLSWIAQQLDHAEAVSPSREAFVFDPIFGVQRERTLEICKLMSARHRRFSWGFLGRVDVLPPDLLGPLSAAGVESVFLGVEAISESALRRMQKVRSAAMADKYVASALAVLDACFEHDITPFVAMMVGYPGDSEADYRTALAFFDQVADLHARSRAQPGVLVYPQMTKIYDNSPLAQRIEQEFPDAILQSGPLMGETFATSAQLGLEAIQALASEMAGKSLLTPRAMDRLQRLWMRPAESFDSFCRAHPALIDAEGVFAVERATAFEDFAWDGNVGGSLAQNLTQRQV